MAHRSFSENVDWIAKRTKKTTILRIIRNSDFRCRHEGFALIAKDHDVFVEDLRPGEFIVFCNSRQTQLAILGPGGLLSFVKSPWGGRIDLETIRKIPCFFNGKEFDYKGALTEHVTTKIKTAA